jgi:hypothetical protein
MEGTTMRLLGTCIACLGLVSTLKSETKNVTWTGWFSDSQCAYARAASGAFSATNPDCAKRCIEKGAASVFIGEQAKAIFKVTDYPSVVEQLGYHVEVTATVDDDAKTISVKNVKQLSREGLACARPKKTSPSQ